MLEEAIKTMHAMENLKARQLIEKVIFMHCVLNIKNNLGWYTMAGCVSGEAAQELDSVFEKAVKDLVPHLNTLVEGLGVLPHKHLMAPIARDYEAFNAQPSNENFESAGEIFDFRNTGAPRL